MNYTDLAATKRDILYAVAALDTNGAATPNRIRRFYEREIGAISGSYVSTSLNELAADGLVSKKRCESDARKWIYFAEPAGRRLIVEELTDRADWLGLDIGRPSLAGQAIQPREVRPVESD